MRRVVKPRSGKQQQAPPEVLLRGLSVLEALNSRQISSVKQVAVQTGLPKATLVRVLHNLVTRGYVQQLPMRKGYMLGERVLNLSSGYRSHDAVVEAGRQHLAAFTAMHKWPVSLATLEVDSMRVRVSTGAESPFATAADRARLNRRVPLLASAHGWAYLAFCPKDEQEIIVSLLKASQRSDDLAARDPHYVDATVQAIRRAGYATSPSLRDEPAIGLAVPILWADRVLATISLRYLGIAPLVLRIFEFRATHVHWDSNAYGSIVWTLLGLHTTHLLTDLIDTLVLAAIMFTRHAENGRRFGDVQDNALYWNFVVFTWLPVYVCIYWVSRW